jgi:hypothetical protein
MEAFRYGVNIPYIQVRAIEVSRKLLLPKKVITCYRRYRRSPPKPVKKFSKPSVFSIELDNKFDILDEHI